MKKYEIVFKNDNNGEYSFINEKSFIEWIFQNKSFLDNDLVFISENDTDVKRVENVYKFLKYYIGVKRKLDKVMDKYNDQLLSADNNDEIKRALMEFVRMNDSGKFLRATLIALGYNTLVNDDEYSDLALALEVFQTSILIHDDIIDNAVVRRGKDTIPVSYINSYNIIENTEEFKAKRSKFADSMAICIADMGFYLAEELIVKGYKNNKYLADILSYYHNVAIRTCHGELIDVALPFKEEFNLNSSDLEENIMEIYRLKTAWYSVVGPYCLGLTLGGASKELIKKCEEILINVGIAFQIKDDLLGIYGDENILGKSTNSDIEEYKQTLLYSYALKTEYKDELQKYYGKANIKDGPKKVKEIFEKCGSKRYAEKMMNKLFKESIDKLSSIDIDSEYKDILLGFIVYLQNRSK